AFTRAPLSTEDVNFAIGTQLMERAQSGSGQSLVIDCHNAETGDVDYVEAGSPISFEMSDALDDAMGKMGLNATGLRPSSKSSPMQAGWAFSAPPLPGLGFGGIKATILSGSDRKAQVYILLDANGITATGRERLQQAVR